MGRTEGPRGAAAGCSVERGEDPALLEQLDVAGAGRALAGQPVLPGRGVQVLVLGVDRLLVDGRVLLGAEVLEAVEDAVRLAVATQGVDVDRRADEGVARGH